jgi:SAM-dependent methyltransferase
MEVGAGRGRCHEFLGLDAKRVVQLDSSRAMLEIQPREECLLRIIHDAENLPFLAGDFAAVVAFLCDPFLGLDFLAEAFRLLAPNGLFLATTPSHEWGVALRKDLGIDDMQTRFLTHAGTTVIVPSILIPIPRLSEMLEFVGFEKSRIAVRRHRLPLDAKPISPDIEQPASKLGVEPHDLDILCSVIAEK